MAVAEGASSSSELSLWFNAPGQDWEQQALPIGNGKLGAALLGEVVTERIQFNEKSQWTGGPGSKEGYNFGFPENPQQYLAKIESVQQQLAQQKKLTPEAVAKQLGSGQPGYGSYQSFADLVLRFPTEHGRYQNYRRALDLTTGIAEVSYQVGQTQFKREYFASYPDQSLVIHLSASEPGQINLMLGLEVPDNRTFQVAHVNGNMLQVQGELTDNGLQYAGAVKVILEQGEVSYEQGQLAIKGADAATLVIAAETNYASSYPTYRGEAALNRLNKRVALLDGLAYATLKSRHLADYQALFSRVELNLGEIDASLPTDRLLQRYAEGASEAQKNALERVYYQYGRYLLLASSRQGSLPANLQGVWNKDKIAPWNGDYHLNINLQMNYWLADSANLAETLPPLFDYVDSLAVTGRKAAQQLFQSPGWVVFLNSNVWGSIGLIEWPTAFWQPEAAAWMARHYYDHFLFTQDESFLATRAYPMMKSVSEFWLHNLILDSDTGLLTVSPSYSPEQGDFTNGAAMSQQIVTDLLQSTAMMATKVGDQAFAQRLEQTLPLLDKGLRVGSWGQLQEWRADLDEPENHHRHVSNLYALHPGDSISMEHSPELAQAAKVSLNARGDGGTGWSKAWKINFWTRLYDGDRAHKLLSEQLKHSTLSNLWSNHPPFQIDGNFGATAGVTEMLLQSHLGFVHLLPALPNAWQNGEVKGLRARGDLTLDMKWQQSRLQTAQLHSGKNQTVSLQSKAFAEHQVEIMSQGQKVTFATDGKQKIIFDVLADQSYIVKVRPTR